MSDWERRYKSVIEQNEVAIEMLKHTNAKIERLKKENEIMFKALTKIELTAYLRRQMACNIIAKQAVREIEEMGGNYNE